MPGDAERCIAETGTVGVMSAEGLLSNPLLFEGRIRPGYELAEEYLDLAVKYKAQLSAVRAHVYRCCHYR
jgi:tRNA-dihydrouridine synthase 1